MTGKQFVAVLAGIFVIACASVAQADMINFDSVSGGAVSNGYGNTSTVTVSYQAVDSTGTVVTGYSNNISVFHPFIFNFYGDLGTVATPPGFGPSGNLDYNEITLTPASGYSVTLDSFEVAPFVGTAPHSQFFALLDQNGNVLTEYTNQTVATSSHLTYSPDYTLNGPITLKFGTSSDIGVNYIDFTSQPSVPVATPEPPSLLLLIVGGMFVLGIVRLMNRRRRTA